MKMAPPFTPLVHCPIIYLWAIRSQFLMFVSGLMSHLDTKCTCFEFVSFLHIMQIHCANKRRNPGSIYSTAVIQLQ